MSTISKLISWWMDIETLVPKATFSLEIEPTNLSGFSCHSDISVYYCTLQPRDTDMTEEVPVCVFCDIGDIRNEDLGELLTKGSLSVHKNCMVRIIVHSTRMNQSYNL